MSFRKRAIICFSMALVFALACGGDDEPNIRDIEFLSEWNIPTIASGLNQSTSGKAQSVLMTNAGINALMNEVTEGVFIIPSNAIPMEQIDGGDINLPGLQARNITTFRVDNLNGSTCDRAYQLSETDDRYYFERFSNCQNASETDQWFSEYSGFRSKTENLGMARKITDDDFEEVIWQESE